MATRNKKLFKYIKRLGDGTYGDVFLAERGEGQERVAIKRNFVSIDISFIGTVKEIDFLSRLKDHPNIVQLLSIYMENPFRNKLPRPKMDHYSVVDTTYFSMKLGIRDGFKVLVDRAVNWEQRKNIVKDLLLGLEYIHAKNIIHRDIKPSNFIEFESENGTKVYKWCDFGLSCNYSLQEEEELDNVVIHAFRAPEILFRNPKYGKKIDVWAMGCLIIELMCYGERSLVADDKKTNNYAILNLILERMPRLPSKKEITDVSGGKAQMERLNMPKEPIEMNYTLKLKKKEINEFNKTAGSYKELTDLVSKMVDFNPDKRLSITEALAHPFFKFATKDIQKRRQQFPPTPNEVRVTFSKSEARKKAYIYYFNFMSEKSDPQWYRERVMFHSLRIFDEFLNDLGVINLSKKDLDSYIKVCLYISIKLFIHNNNSTTFDNSFRLSLGKAEESKHREMEKYIIGSVLKGCIYEDTLLEMVDKELTIETKNLLFHFYGLHDDVQSKLLSELYADFLKLDEKSKKKLLTKAKKS